VLNPVREVESAMRCSMVMSRTRHLRAHGGYSLAHGPSTASGSACVRRFT